MSASKSFKWQGSRIYVGLGFAPASPALVISGATQTDPVALTVTGHGLDDGDVALVSGVLGMTDLNDRVAIVQVVDANHIELVDVDATGYDAYISGGTLQLADYSNFCELTSYNRTGGTSAEIDATSICSTAVENEVGLADFGTTALDYKFAPRTAIQRAIQAAYKAGDVVPLRVELPKNGGVMVQLGYITQTSEQSSNGALWTGSMSFRNTGDRFDVEAA